MYTVKNNYVKKQKYVGCRCSSVKHYLLLSFHILALWNILTAVQLLTMIAVPLGVLLPIHPQVTIICIITVLLTPVGFTLIVAYVLYQCQQPRRRNFQSSVKCCGSMCVFCRDYCNHWTHSRTSCPVRADAAGASTNWNWIEGSISVTAPIIPTVCTGMVREEEIPEEKEDPEEIRD